MFRNEQELLNSLFTRLHPKANDAKKPSPLTREERAEIENYRDNDGYINLTKVESMNDLKRLVELVDRKNHLEEIENGPESIQDFVGDLLNELLPLVGLEKASLKVNTPAGKASVEVEQGKSPKIVYDTEEKCEDTTLTYKVTPSEPLQETIDETCHLHECCTCPDFKECFNDVVGKINNNGITLDEAIDNTELSPEEDVTPLTEDETKFATAVLETVGGDYNPLFYNAVLYICENNKEFENYDIYRFNEDVPEDVNTYILLPNAFGKIFESAAETYAEYLRNGAAVYLIDPETFELVEITNPFDLYDYVMTEAQAEVMWR